jgi:glycyl-tRNA synthetase
MVSELPSLHGVMGREYARLDCEPEPVAMGIYEHTLPRHAGDALPSLPAAMAVGIADRLDTLVGLFAAGLAPRATADPFALRRTALGLVQILAGRGLGLDLRAAVGEAGALQPVPVPDAVREEVLAFIRRRLEQSLLDGGARPDVVQAVLGARPHSPAPAAAAVDELGTLVDTPEFREAHAAFTRAARIVRARQGAGAVEAGRAAGADDVDPQRFTQEAEQTLWEALRRAEAELTTGAAGAAGATVGQLVRSLRPLVAPIDAFFGEVRVLTEDDQLRESRLALLRRVVRLADGIADLTQLQGGGG